MLWGYGIAEGEAAVRTAVFQAVSIMTTTGMASADFALWPPVLLLALFALMFVGGSAGSTGGSIKVVRHLLLGKVLRREVDQTLSPEVVMPIRLNGAPVDERTIRAIAVVHPPVRRLLGRRRVERSPSTRQSAASRVGTLDALAASATTLGNVGPGSASPGRSDRSRSTATSRR